MQPRTLGTQGLEVAAIGLGTMGMTMAYGPGDDDERNRRHPPRPRAGRDVVRHRRAVRRWAPAPTSSSSAERSKDFRDEVVIATKFGFDMSDPHVPGPSTAGPSTSARSPRTACATSAPTTSTCSTSTASIPTCRSRRSPARSRSSSMRARSATSASARPGRRRIRRAHAVQPVSVLQTEYSLFERAGRGRRAAGAARARHRLRRRTPRSDAASSPATSSPPAEYPDDDMRSCDRALAAGQLREERRRRSSSSPSSPRQGRHRHPARPRVAAGPGRRHRAHPRHPQRGPASRRTSAPPKWSSTPTISPASQEILPGGAFGAPLSRGDDAGLVNWTR